MSRKKKTTNNASSNTNNGNTSSTKEWMKIIIPPLLALIGVLVTAYVTYMIAIEPKKMEMAATQTAEAKLPPEVLTVTNVAAEEEPPMNGRVSNCFPIRTSKMQGENENISAAIAITKPKGECPVVSERENIELNWSVSPADTYFLWVFIYSPGIKQYFPHACGAEPLQPTGTTKCWVTFSRTEPYEIVIVLADRVANAELKKSLFFNDATLPQGIEEKASLAVYRTP